ncbi:MAG: GNAT family N-acetyltransferase [Limnochordia bacterium]|jgi:ribosomal protein S18 acetylase RimI-like enzyme|nr:GNAT family N-acetyltransferase [Bacillota bacterium]HOB09566.1 GNAT family N-acetyltransferase [Limnochordia bacterium]HPT94009.1 GNAT family N-acetyltransferase [Limnochordia bacterium]HPZ31699.1 GNAT family N-acetyltransferase [Limnochordia bacterium]HQD71164.1 GNAT family N-acetyltransferase [Limnochordia bacterium]
MSNANVTILEMQPSDYHDMYELWRSTPGIGLSNADTKENLEKFLDRNKGLSFVCKHEDRLIGTVLCGHDGRRGYIYHAAVAEAYRGKGIGRSLIEKSLEKLKAEGINKCHLFVIADNTSGHHFWTSVGWYKRDDILVYSKDL